MRSISLAIFSCLLLISACKSGQNVVPQPEEETSCTMPAKVQDYSGLDGCSKILITQDGYKILPTDPNILKPYIAQSEVEISYVKKDDMVSICMAEDFIADITCIQSNEKPMAKECTDATSLTDLKWLSGLPAYQIEKVDKYSMLTDSWAYIITYQANHVAYNCQGDLLCSYKDKPDIRCKAILNEMTFVKTIHSNKSSR